MAAARSTPAHDDTSASTDRLSGSMWSPTGPAHRAHATRANSRVYGCATWAEELAYAHLHVHSHTHEPVTHTHTHTQAAQRAPLVPCRSCNCPRPAVRFSSAKSRDPCARRAAAASAFADRFFLRKPICTPKRGQCASTTHTTPPKTASEPAATPPLSTRVRLAKELHRTHSVQGRMREDPGGTPWQGGSARWARAVSPAHTSDPPENPSGPAATPP